MPQEGADLFKETEGLSRTRHVYSVSEITQSIKIILESSIGDVWVEGEISNFQAHTSGHFYFTLKDDAAVLPAAMFIRANREIKFKVENGLKVICFGKVSAYGPRGNYQIIVEKMEPKGIGGLQLALEQLKKKLEKEGLFAKEHKRNIPPMPSRIGIVTSLQGAAIKDMLKVLDRRFSDLEVIINPAKVQGEGAREEIAQGIQNLNLFSESLPLKNRIEVMIVGRGGGSIEDLWAFNEEIVARAIYASKIPVISAVGHERDWTIADLVADMRSPTPSAAAEQVVPVKEDVLARLQELSGRLMNAFSTLRLDCRENVENLMHRLLMSTQNIMRSNVQGLEALKNKLTLLNPAVRLEQYQEKVLGFARQIFMRTQHFVQLRQAAFAKATERLSGLSPLNILSRGYSITFKLPEIAVVKDAQAVKAGDTLRTKLHKGEIISKVTEVTKDG